MKTSKEFLENLKTDIEFGKIVNEKLETIKKEGKLDYIEAIIEVAKELGYSLDAEEVKKFIIRFQQSNTEGALDDNMLDGVAGGEGETSCPYCTTFDYSALSQLPCFAYVGGSCNSRCGDCSNCSDGC